MSQRGMGDLMKKLPRKVEENFAKNTRIAELQSEVVQMKNKVNQIERHQSKDCLIFRNLPFSSNVSYLSVVIDLIQNVLNVKIEQRDLKACHLLGRGSPFNPSPVIAKLSISTKGKIGPGRVCYGIIGIQIMKNRFLFSRD